MEESKSSTRDGNSVIDAFPSESLVVVEGNLLLSLEPPLVDLLGSLLPLTESRVKLGGLLGRFSRNREAETTECGSLKTPF